MNLTLAGWRGQKILIIGDLMADFYVCGKASKLCPEAPVPVIKIESTTLVPGGAANLAANIHSLGGLANLVGITGTDTFGQQLLTQLSALGIGISGIQSLDRPTTVKTRIMTQQQMVARTDHEDITPLPRQTEETLIQAIQDILPQIALVVISDYAKGVVSQTITKQVLTLCRIYHKACLVDPKGSNYRKYRGATIITPNLTEAEKATGISILDEASLRRAGQALLKLTGSSAVLITRGDQGLSIFQKNGEINHFPATASDIGDVIGAGDTLIASLAMAMAAGCDLLEACFVANVAAGLAVHKNGTAMVYLEELLDVLTAFDVKTNKLSSNSGQPAITHENIFHQP